VLTIPTIFVRIRIPAFRNFVPIFSEKKFLAQKGPKVKPYLFTKFDIPVLYTRQHKKGGKHANLLALDPDKSTKTGVFLKFND
jgi:hypothetical protein